MNVSRTVNEDLKRIWKKAVAACVEALYQNLNSYLPENGGTKYLRNICELLPDYTALKHRRKPSLCPPLKELQILF
jgi:hypothetical protein